MEIDPSLEMPAAQMARQLLETHGETVTYSHMAWLVRECAKLMARDMELTRREQELKQKERSLHRRRSRGRSAAADAIG